jgi:membrane-bound serine protease (ClpP class)
MLIILLALVSAVIPHPAGGQSSSQDMVLILDLDGPLTPAMREYLNRGLTTAEQRGYGAVILRLDTPGGSISHMQEMVSLIRGSRMPVVVYIAPRGAIAGSAGTVITLAGHRSAMAPETAIGAASPVGPGGEDLGETLRAKTEEIIKAQIRSLAADRGPEAVTFAEQTVEEARAASAREALQVGLVDYLAEDLADLLTQLDGAEIMVQGQTVTLRTAGVEPDFLPRSLIEELLQLLTNPNIIFILISLGAQALIIEIGNPGTWVPGFIGVVALSLAGYGLGILPVNWFGVIFLITAFVLFALEVKAPSFGALTAAGVGSLITGALVLFNSPGAVGVQRVSVLLVVVTSVLTGGVFALVTSFALRAQRMPIRTGREALANRIGFAATDVRAGQGGQVRVGGERWRARLDPGSRDIRAGEKIRVTGSSGNTLLVAAENE